METFTNNQKLIFAENFTLESVRFSFGGQWNDQFIEKYFK